MALKKLRYDELKNIKLKFVEPTFDDSSVIAVSRLIQHHLFIQFLEAVM